MSLLREAEKCLLNQRRYARLNALITPLRQQHKQDKQDPRSSSSSWRDRVFEAELRREKGRHHTHSTHPMQLIANPGSGKALPSPPSTATSSPSKITSAPSTSQRHAHPPFSTRPSRVPSMRRSSNNYKPPGPWWLGRRIWTSSGWVRIRYIRSLDP